MMPELDRSLYDIYFAFLKIMQGVEQISLVDIKAYSDLFKVEFDDWEIDAILGLDQERLKRWQKTQQ